MGYDYVISQEIQEKQSDSNSNWIHWIRVNNPPPSFSSSSQCIFGYVIEGNPFSMLKLSQILITFRFISDYWCHSKIKRRGLIFICLPQRSKVPVIVASIMLEFHQRLSSQWHKCQVSLCDLMQTPVPHLDA